MTTRSLAQQEGRSTGTGPLLSDPPHKEQALHSINWPRSKVTDRLRIGNTFPTSTSRDRGAERMIESAVSRLVPLIRRQSR